MFIFFLFSFLRFNFWGSASSFFRHTCCNFFPPNVMFLLLSIFPSLYLLKYLKHTYFYVPLKLSHFLYFPACNASLSLLLLFLTRGLSPSCPHGKSSKPSQTLSAQRSRGHWVLPPLTLSSLLLASGAVGSTVLLLVLDINAHPCMCAHVCPHSSCSSALGEGTALGQFCLLS